jgi:hypothetical protein
MTSRPHNAGDGGGYGTPSAPGDSGTAMTQSPDIQVIVERVAETAAWLAAPGPIFGPSLAEEHARDLTALLSRLQELEAERDEAQSATTAWQEVYESLEAHLMDRVAMGDPGRPETYLSILRSSVAGVVRASRQIVQARWADAARSKSRAEASEARIRELEGAAERLLASIDLIDPHQAHCSTVAYLDLRAVLNPQEAS